VGEQEEARRLVRRAQELEPNRADTFLFVGEMAIKAGQLEQARQALLQALERQPRIPGGNRQLGMVLDRMGDRGGAEQAWLAALATDPRDATAHLLLGQLMLDLDKPQEALRYLTNAVALDPDTPNAYYTLSQTQLKLGQAEVARATLQRFQTLKRQEQQAADQENSARDNAREMRGLILTFHLQAGLFLEEQERLELAEAHYRQAARVHPEASDSYDALTGFLLRQRRMTEARNLWKDLSERHPDRAHWHISYASLLLQLGETTAARSALEKGLALDPNRVDALNNLVRIYLGSGQRLPRALEFTSKLVGLEPSAANYDLLAWAHYANGQIDRAREASARSIELAPDNPVFRARYNRLKEVR
jgi:tetratricopeptide (TPR) repeat protein